MTISDLHDASCKESKLQQNCSLDLNIDKYGLFVNEAKKNLMN